MLPNRLLRSGTTALRAWTETDDDVAFLVAGWNDPVVDRWSPKAGERTPGAARAVIAAVAAPAPCATTADLVVVDATTGRRLGEVGATQIDHGRGTALVGWWLIEGARGQGHAVRAVDRFTEWLFDDIGLRRVAAVVAQDNAASIAVAEGAGFRHGATTPSGDLVFERRAESATVRSRP